MNLGKQITTISIITFIVFSGCKTTRSINRVSYESPINQTLKDNWSDIFNENKFIDSFKILNTGSVKVPLKGVLNTSKLDQNHNFDKYVWVDVFSFLFHHQEKGWFQIDTGLDSTFQKEGNIKGLFSGLGIKASKQEKGQNIGAQLLKENKKVNGIFFTHLHSDHTSGLPEINDSMPMYVGKGEKYENIPLLYYNHHLNSSDTLIEIDFEKGNKIGPLESVIDVFGDGSFFAIKTAGHSSSHISYILNKVGGPILLTGDVSHTKYGFINNIEPGWTHDRELAVKSLQQLKELTNMFPNLRTIYGHEL